MKHHKISRSLFFSMLLFVFSCSNKLDNYEPPNASLSGALIDIQRNDTVSSANSIGQGGILNLFQLNYSSTNSSALGSNFSNEGTYKNTAIFAGTYKVAPSGPFYADTTTVTVSGDTKLDIKVKPWIYVTLQTGAVTDSSITLRFQLKSNDPVQQIVTAGAFLNTASTVDVQEYLGVTTGNTQYRNLRTVSGDTSLTVTFKGLSPNTAYYVRAGGRMKTSVINPQNYYNYSRIYMVKTKG